MKHFMPCFLLKKRAARELPSPACGARLSSAPRTCSRELSRHRRATGQIRRGFSTHLLFEPLLVQQARFSRALTVGLAKKLTSAELLFGWFL
jgi:hypothetical protein